MVHKSLLDILVCPETKQALELAPPELLDAVNRSIRAGELTAQSGQAVTEEIHAGLVREDGQQLFPVRDEIPVMLVDESIPLAQLP